MKNQIAPAVEVSYIPQAAEQKDEKKIILKMTDDLINDEPTAKMIADLQGFQEYDLENVHYISNTGLANMVDLLKASLQKGIEVHFLNASEKIKNKIHALGMDSILNFY